MNYIPNVWTRAKKYGPLVFGTLAQAREFMANNTSSFTQDEIWECEARDAEAILYIVKIPLVLQSKNKLVALMNKLFNNGDWLCGFTKEAPTGTYITSQIKLIRRVQ
jgi:hypothetical protein